MYNHVHFPERLFFRKNSTVDGWRALYYNEENKESSGASSLVFPF